MINNVVLMGRLTANPEILQVKTGAACPFTIAIERKFSKDKTVDYIPCSSWGKTAEFIAKYFKKGQMIYVVGNIQNYTYKDKMGEEKTINKIIVENAGFCGSSKKDAGAQAEEEPNFIEFNDELPF